jgi:acyl carrier protein
LSDSVFQAVIPVITKRFIFEGDLTPETRFIEDLGADSLDIIELANDMEIMFGITIQLDDLAKMRTIADAVDYIDNHRGSQHH